MSRWLLGGGLSVSVVSLAVYAMTVGMPVQKSEIPSEMETIYASMLKQAESLAARDRFAQALQEVQGIPRNSRSFQQAQEFQESWSKEVLQQALEQYRQGNLDQALVALRPIPFGVSVRSQAQAFQKAWTQEAKFLNQALSAATNRDWSSTLRSLEALRGTGTYTTPRVQTLLEQAIANAFDPSITTIRLATAPPVQSSPFTQPIAPLTQFTPPRLTPLAVDTESAIAQSEPRTAETTVASNPPAPSTRSAPVPVTPILPVPSLPPAPIASSELPSAPVARTESTQTPPATTLQENRTPQTIETSPQTQPSSTALPSPATSSDRNSEEIAQSEAGQREQTVAPQAVQPSSKLTAPSQPQPIPSSTENTSSTTARDEVQPSQQLPQAEVTPPLPVPAKVPSPSTIDNQPSQIEALPSEPSNPDLIAELPPAERALMLKPLDTQTLQKVTNVLQANTGTDQSSQPAQSNAVSAR
ncbi:hypothetical protein [Leptolyngbya sp. NIES-2104]|uniref:hypothetical protein n=1 Tax=Leptolyngbya sp. NIES-2104 TaxID=1552121 RepID=UPI0006EC7D6D|nr:hypothetical protein [Leptolyngbya sp. NIES-2104]GAP99598.1 flagellar hook-length control protein FliK [Leptolyngbya sp. NIES-2104]